jgi:putative FmdB family regulatory protein
MPTYEFRCPQGHEFEKFYRTIGSAEAQAICPECQLPAERVMSAAGFAFKGSGFYLTDYGKNAHRDKGTAEPRTGAPAGESGAGGESARSEPAGEASAAPAAAATPSSPAPAAAAGESKPAKEPKKRDTGAAESKPAAPKKSASE